MQFIDLSLILKPNQSEPAPITIDYISHEQGAEILGKPIGLSKYDFPDEMGISTEHVALTSHSGTHIDAPLHYGPYCEGKRSKSIAELPLHWFYADAVVIRLSPDPAMGVITTKEIQDRLLRINYTIKPYDIVLLQTNGDQFWEKPEYFTHFRGVSVEATEFLTSQGVKVIGVDTFGFDPPFHTMLEQYAKTKDKKELWPAHLFGRKKEYCQIERLTNLSAIPVEHGFKIICFPIKISKSGAGWVRAVAQINT